jgi:neutral ceramidase
MKLTGTFLILVAALSFGLAGAAPVRAELKAGAGKADITPKESVFLGGYYMLNERSKGIHDPLHTRALVLDDGANKLVIINLDLVIMSIVMGNEIKDEIQKKYGIPPENVNISVQHTHTGPEGYYQEFGKYPKEYVPAMKDMIKNRALDAVAHAMETLAPATVGFEQFDLPEFNHNRHNGRGPSDKTAVLLVVKDAGGKPVAGFLNYASHPTVVPAGDMLISGEWTGVFQSLMEEKMGGDSVFLYLQGASGNQGPGTRGEVERDGKIVKLDGWGSMQDMAERLTAAIFPRLAEVATKSDITLAAARKDYVFPVRTKKQLTEFTAAKPGMIKAIQDDPKLTTDEKNERIGWINEKYGIETFMTMLFPTMSRIKKGKTATYIEAMRIGDLLLLAFPGEAITELSIEIRKDLAPKTVAVLGYSNDHLGYLTTPEIFEEGGYEAGMGLVNSDATLEMLSGLLELAAGLEKK